MFERFTERARKVVVLAQEEAGRLRHNYIGTEHLLLGLLCEGEGVAAQVLTSLGVTLDGARGQVESIVGYGEENPGEQAPFTPRSKKVLEFALRESMQLGHNYIGTEHILLGLVRESEGVAARVLSNLDVDPDKVCREVVRMLGEEPTLDPVERSLEEGEITGNQMLFRGRIGSLQVSVRVGGRPGTLLVDLDYSYSAGDTGEHSEAMDHEEILERVAAVLEGREYPSVEAAVLEAGRLVLDRFPTVHELEICAVRERLLERRTASGITVSRTFRR
jgi:dihydroneopterin aldolase